MALDKFSLTITDKLNTGVIIVDVDANIVEWNRFLEVHANKSPDAVMGQSIYSIFPELPQRWFARKLAGVFQLNTPAFCSWEQRHHLFELPHTRPISTDSLYMAQNCTFLPLENNGKIEHVCILIEDATDVCHFQTMLKRTMQELEHANKIDGLTQILNRNHWEKTLQQEFSRARRYDHDLALIMFDLDHFKRLNDTYGHQCGDKVLTDTAATIESLLRVSDHFGRYGGEEFAIILPETDLIGAADVAERIRSKVANMTIEFQQQNISCTISIGVSLLTEREQCHEELIKSADVALYKAKSGGRNRVSVAKQLTKDIAQVAI